MSHEIKELLEKRDSLNRQLTQATAELLQVDDQREQHIKQLETAKRKYAVTKSQIKYIENEIFQLKQKFKTIKDTAEILNLEIQDIYLRLNSLEPEKKKLKESILDIKASIKNIISDNQSLQQALEKERSRLKQLLTDKQQLSSKIAPLLAQTDLDQETIESDLLQINEKYIDQLNETNAIKQKASDLSTELTTTRTQITNYKSKLSELMRVKVLTKEVNTLSNRLNQHQKDNELFTDRLATLKKSLSDKKISLARMSEENKHRNNQIQALESTVGAYDKALTTFTTMENQYQDVNHQVEIDMDAIRQMLDDQNSLTHALYLAEEKASMIIENLMKGDF